MLVCAGAATAGHAQAQSSATGRDVHACFAWTAHQVQGCPTETAIRTSVEGLLGHPAFIGDRCDLIVRGKVGTSAEHATLVDISFHTRDGATLGQRRLEGNNPNCSAYAGPISLVIALMIESVQVDATLVETPASVMPPTPLPPRNHEANATTAPAANAKANPRAPWAVMADTRAAWGLLPGMSLGFGAAVEMAPAGWLPLRLESAWWLPSQSQHPGPGGRFWAWQAGIGCYPFTHDGPVRTQLLAGLDFGNLFGNGTGLEFAQTTRRPYGEVALRLANTIVLFGPVDLVLQTGIAVPWLRPGFVYLDPSGTSVRVHRPEPLIVEAGLGLAWRMGASHTQAGGAP
jgi:hypothetical protein